jgi:hypothetical protein
MQERKLDLAHFADVFRCQPVHVRQCAVGLVTALAIRVNEP